MAGAYCDALACPCIGRSCSSNTCERLSVPYPFPLHSKLSMLNMADVQII